METDGVEGHREGCLRSVALSWYTADITDGRRLLPTSWVIWAAQELNAKSKNTMIAFPAWEIIVLSIETPSEVLPSILKPHLDPVLPPDLIGQQSHYRLAPQVTDKGLPTAFSEQTSIPRLQGCPSLLEGRVPFATLLELRIAIIIKQDSMTILR